MRRVIPLEFHGQQELYVDLYNADGDLVFKKGEQITPELMMKMNFLKLYKKEEKIEKLEIESVISKTATESLIKNTRKIIENTFDGDTPDSSVCENARDTIIEEVAAKIEEIECIGQLRVFDEYTFSHTVNVSSMASALGIQLGLSEQEVKDLSLAALLHDIGKMRVPREILNKPGKLTNDEFDIMKSHTTLGYRVIKDEMNQPDHIAKVALEHQEKYGGFGYPHGKKGKEISLFAQVTSIADVYDALVSKRVYKDPLPSHEAIKIMLSDGSKAFNPFMLYKFVYLANHKDTSGLVVE